MRISLTLALASLIAATSCMAQNRPKENATVFIDSDSKHLRQQLTDLTQTFKARVGVAVISIEDRDTFTLNNNHPYPMQSVFKFPLAMAVLHEVDKGKLSLSQKILVRKTDLMPGTWSPMAEKYPDGNISLTLGELLKYSVSMSDNNACDILFRTIKGTAVVDRYVKQLGVKDIAIKATEAEMHKAWNVQYSNHSTPYAMARLLDIFYRGKALSASSTSYLLKLMTESSNSDKCIKGELPKEATVAHKTGNSGANKDGLTAATNDVGIVTLPDGKHFAIVVFVSDSKESADNNNKMIALISLQVYNHLGMRSVGKH